MDLFKKTNGFSLIEILVSIVILSVSLLALTSLMAITTKNNSFGGHVTEAATFAQDKLEELRVRPWDYIITSKDTSSVGSNGIRYIRNWTVLTNLDGNLKTINITINWNDGNDHSFSILSAVTN